MKHLFSITLILLILSSIAFSQVGSDCANSHLITGLPFSLTGMTTAGSGDDYDNGSCCGSVYMTGEDYVFEYTPTVDIPISVIVTNTGIGTGVFVTQKCPDDPSAICEASEEAQNGNPQVHSVQLLAGITYYIIVSTYDAFNMNPNTNFDIEIKESIPFDAGVVSFHNRSDCDLDNAVHLTIQIKNFGYDTLNNIPVAYKINGGVAVIDTFYGTILPLNVEYYTFLTLVDLSIPDATYNIKAYTLYSIDGNISNDSLETNVTHSIYANVPYYEDFESGQGGWVTERINSSISLSSWEYGVPNGTIIDSAASVDNAWVTNLSGDFNPFEKSYVLSPCFDLSSLIMPIFEFNIWYETEDSDYIVFSYSLDNGYTWIAIGNEGDAYNWYNGTINGSDAWNGSSGGWLNAKHVLNDVAGVSKVQFRIYFEGGVNGTNEGFAFDDVKIYESPLNDLGIVNIIYPEDGCGLSSNEDITVKIANAGLYDQHDFNLSYSVDGGNTFVSEMYTDTIISEDTLIYTFTTQADLSTNGLLNLIAFVDLPLDSNSNNDTIVKDIFHFNTISTYSYQEDFELNNGGWYATGFRSTWQHGVPADTTIDYAASGNNAWVTNLTGIHNDAEQSFLYTPCFDFSDLLKPKVDFYIWYDQENLGTQFEYSVDGGQNWSVYGSSTDNNWYNQGYNWIGHSGDWVNVFHGLHDFAGEQQIQFRYKFLGTTGFSGFAVDNFTICEEPTAGFSYMTNGLEITFADTSLHGNTYYWDFGDTTNSTDQNPVHIYNYTDTVTVTQIVYNDCSNDTTHLTFHVTGINTLSIENIKIFPNPTSNELYIKATNKHEKIKYEIINQQGNIMLNGHFEGNKKIKLNVLNKGLYYIKLYVSNDIIIEKLIII